ncbi:hypothetical protein [Streptomyces sp. NBC_00299]|jgi:hypothetical protein|uniref:hypothetical protein n=1 Tax=Streptomyces sp. NBC_00299 TaxID=2975705 RepID=UPI002E295A9A|nr:hypothetical protein [Streptomyces sp. NBC_00299]
MRNKVTAISAIAAGIVLASGGTAAADTNTTTVKGGSGFSSSPVVVNAPQQGVLIVNGTLVDARCAVPWSNGAVLAGTVAPNSKYVGCNTGTVEQGRGTVHKGGLLF